MIICGFILTVDLSCVIYRCVLRPLNCLGLVVVFSVSSLQIQRVAVTNLTQLVELIIEIK